MITVGWTGEFHNKRTGETAIVGPVRREIEQDVRLTSGQVAGGSVGVRRGASWHSVCGWLDTGDG